MAPSRPRLFPFAVLLLVGLGLGLRSDMAWQRPLHVDEAESAINALTILEHGVPRSEYMGLPIFENTLITRWPESAEYEFRDLSYSRDGLAMYHSWVPLYAMAIGLRAAGITPDPPAAAAPRPRHGPETWRWRRFAARLPSLVFAAGFVALMYVFGWRLGGRGTAAAAAVLAALSPISISLGSAGRYYSATLFFSALCGLTLWRLYVRGRPRDHAWHALAMAGLFHTHVLSCLIVGLLSFAILPRWWRSRDFVRGALLSAAVFGALVLPWIVVTGFPGEVTGLPRAVEVMALPIGILLSSKQSLLQGALWLTVVVVVLLARRGHHRIPLRWRRPVQRRSSAMLFVAGWAALAFWIFSLTIPMASYFAARMAMVLAVPKLLLVALALAACAEALRARYRLWLPSGLALVLLFVATDVGRTPVRRDEDSLVLTELHSRFGDSESSARTRIYFEPSQQLVVQYLLGLPCQSIAPVRREYLDRYPGEIVYVVSSGFAPAPDPEWILDVARAAGEPLTHDEAERISRWLRVEEVAAVIGERPAHGLPPRVAVPEPVRAAWAAKQRRDRIGWWYDVPAFEGFDVQDAATAWKVFFYRFVDPRGRSGEGANYAGRLRNATAQVLYDEGLLIWRSSGEDPSPRVR